MTTNGANRDEKPTAATRGKTLNHLAHAIADAAKMMRSAASRAAGWLMRILGRTGCRRVAAKKLETASPELMASLGIPASLAHEAMRCFLGSRPPVRVEVYSGCEADVHDCVCVRGVFPFCREARIAWGDGYAVFRRRPSA